MIGKRWIIGCWIAVMGVCLMACAPQAVREAQSVVAQADSLWHEGKQYGMDEGDSATLAQAYKTLEAIPLPFREGLGLGSPYAHACYHYGKLLRAKENPVEAMQAFIAATHSGTKDYHILGRVYSNMGDIAHLAGEYPLSYDMFEKSADMYLKNGDSLLYYYCLNEMAFELAEQGEKEETIILIDSITHCCNDRNVKIKTLETKALLYQSLKCHDSVITAIDSLQSVGYNDVIDFTMKARAFHNLNLPDSALYYANCVVQHSPTNACAIAAYYILSHSKDTINKDSILILASARADAQKAWAYSQSELAQAVQLLKQDLTHKPDYRWLYMIMVTLVVVGVCIYAYIHRKRRQHALLSQQVDDLNIQNEEAKTQHEDLTKKIDTLSQLHNAHHMEIVSDIERFCALMRCNQDIREQLHWNNFTEMCSLSDRYLYNIVTRLQPYNLSQKETRLCILVLLKANTNQMVDMIPYSHSGLGKFKNTTAKKIGTTTTNFRPFLLKLLG